jgi:uncharacterized Ntn-hydrolase superfamily protein
VSNYPRPSTFSIVAHDPDAGEWGVAVASRFLAVGAVVPFARAGVGAVATQSYANMTFGPAGLALMAEGYAAQDALNGLLAADPGREHRQVGMVDGQGRAATFTGSECYSWAGGSTGLSYAAQGNILTGPEVVGRMAETFEGSGGALVDRLLQALAAGQEAGGDSRGQQSAALLVVRAGAGYAGFSDRYVDLRVDDHERPIEELARLLTMQKLLFFPTRPEDVLPIDSARATEIQQLLAHSGHRRATVTGVYDAETRDGLRALVGAENLENRWREGAEVDRVVLEYLTTRYAPGNA